MDYVEAQYGQELRRLLAGGVAFRHCAAVQGALAGRCGVSRQEARLWCLAFGDAPGSSEAGGREE
eukprot:14496508-Alexandrium_andersonii.AAC.1